MTDALVNGRLASIPFPELSTPFRGSGSRPCNTVQCTFRRAARHLSRLWCITTTGPFIPLTIADLPVQALLTLHDVLLIGCSRPWEPGNRREHGCAHILKLPLTARLRTAHCTSAVKMVETATVLRPPVEHRRS